MTPRPSRLSALPALIASIFVLQSCGGGGGGGGGSISRTDILLTDAPVDDLLAFSATITDLRLDLAGGGSTADLLAGDAPVEMIGLQGSPAWLAAVDPPAGTYTGVRVGFLPGSYDARRNDGSAVTVNAASNVLVAPFAAPLTIAASGYRRLTVDLDLLASLSGSVTAPPLLFDPSGASTDDSGSTSVGIDEIKGVVQSANAGAQSLVIDAFVDDDQTVPLGAVTVHVGPATLLLDDDGTVFASASAFFGALVPGSTLLEVHGALQNGVVQATRIEIEDNAAGGGSQNLVKIEGLVLDLGPGSTFEIAIAEVEDGLSIVRAAFGGVVPPTMTVTWDPSTVFFLEEHQLTTSASLAIGQEVKVKFATFSNPPFVASRVEIEGLGVEFEGTITSLAGLPGSFTVHLEGDDPAILSGQVASTSADVTVTLGGSPIFLDVPGQPSLSTAELLLGLKVQPEGSISGPPTAPVIAATKVKVFAGRLDDALVTGVSSGTSSFVTSGGTIEDPFGISLTPGPMTIQIAPGAVFRDDATSAAAFYALFQGLGGGQSLQVEVFGIGTGAADTIRAHEIRSRVQ